MFWRELKSFFYFRPKEKRGILILSFFCLLFIGYRFTPSEFEEEYMPLTGEVEQGIIDSFECFHISRVPPSILMAFGLSERQINTIDNFQNKVRPIKEWSDLYSLYNFEHKLLDRLGSSMIWEKEVVVDVVETTTKISLDLNVMTSGDFRKQFKVSKKVANRIIAYRRLLGGFYALNQLCEVYYFSCDKLGGFLAKKEDFDYSKVKQLSLNNSTFETLSKHPYISKEQCKAIVVFRSGLPQGMKPEDLNNLRGFSKAEIKKLIPYLSD